MGQLPRAQNRVEEGEELESKSKEEGLESRSVAESKRKKTTRFSLEYDISPVDTVTFWQE